MTNEAFEKTIFDVKQTIVQTLMTPTHKAGWPFIIGFALVSLFLALLSTVLGFVGLVLTLWCLYFFRDPVRMVPTQRSLVLSPADGRVTAVTAGVDLPEEIRSEGDAANAFTRISIFLSVFDVHVNRIPVSGTIQKIVYKPGLFLNAGNERASIENERCAALVLDEAHRKIGFVQIAGLIARRIICEAKEGDEVKGGERYGLIRFGSRMDIYIPKDVAPLVVVGQRAVGGETILADLNQDGPAREAQPV